MKQILELFSAKGNRKMTKAEKAMCASIVAVCLIAAALICVVNVVL